MAKAGVGKGKLAQDLCLARVTGGSWLGLTVEPGPALFWSGEQGQREDFRVTQALGRGRGLTASVPVPQFFEIVYDPPVRFGHPAMTAYVMARLRAFPGLLIVMTRSGARSRVTSQTALPPITSSAPSSCPSAPTAGRCSPWPTRRRPAASRR